MAPIIFLDIDGVLCVSSHILSIPEKERLDKWGMVFSPSCVAELYRIIEISHADIVLSSSWKLMKLNKVKQMWIDRNLPGNVVDVTPDVEEGGRGNEINQWMKDNFIPDQYVIIDDDKDMLPSQLSHFVHTKEEMGLTHEKSNEAIKILIQNI